MSLQARAMPHTGARHRLKILRRSYRRLPIAARLAARPARQQAWSYELANTARARQHAGGRISSSLPKANFRRALALPLDSGRFFRAWAARKEVALESLARGPGPRAARAVAWLQSHAQPATT